MNPFHGPFKSSRISPSQARTVGAELKAYPRISFQISIKGMEMNYRIERKDSFSVFGVEKVISTVDGQNFIDIPEFWHESYKNGMVEKIIKASGIEWMKEYRSYACQCGHVL